MVDIALDPNMYYASMSTAQTLFKAAELGFDYVELSPNTEFHFWHRCPKADDDFVAGLNKAQKDSGVTVRTLNPVFNWSSPDEQERAAQVRNWHRLLELADQINVREIVSEFSGNPNTPVRCEEQWYKSIFELAPDFEKYGITLSMEAHPYDFVERHDDAYSIVRGTNLDWIGYEFCCPHTFHLDDGVGDVERMITSCAPKLREVHVADTLNHRANDGNRYIVNPPGVDARVHQHSEIGKGEVPFDKVFETLRAVGFDGVLSLCVFGFHEHADEINRRMLERVRSEFGA
ncbi:sugar phosphate isomerase/epimerase family protein [Propionibacterium freudenreichii]|uniref:sugar phosphate isomerase/epimerase family protein n=1 Tax=Propionibacterium freudenreichii TaxID=1744 RepID=UPI000BC34D30|nr:sugar phosphate isomerase/epimerase [Propionibacterium freudenreichii]MDK9300938.1 sugar phosphate isomerase/epimerase [Propionibacterium freudenreichii]MDK9322694.1 sugar phosphate isomerase/epimerase [Propionibacterium freudenreichii]MDK9325007.1 sugar phosphate isomerase/epimerase [Propionibacterium freudenreichii]MDK9339431.1 sugar phosphate isomerase/epimerase [Propionibacterium freudenreichii]MDK9648118.1 sugar phosphate isomerase/epimerase [Propionibacterium freudenreichii]